MQLFHLLLLWAGGVKRGTVAAYLLHACHAEMQSGNHQLWCVHHTSRHTVPVPWAGKWSEEHLFLGSRMPSQPSVMGY